MQTDEQLLINQPDKEQKRAAVMDEAVRAESNIRKKRRHRKIEKQEERRLEQMWKAIV